MVSIGARLLTVKNEGIELADACRRDDVWYMYLSSTPELDIYAKELGSFESVCGMVIELKCAKGNVVLPPEWLVLCMERDTAETALMPVARVTSGFTPVVFNPFRSYVLGVETFQIAQMVRDAFWIVPETGVNEAIVYPLVSGDNPPCIVVARPGARLNRQLDQESLL